MKLIVLVLICAVVMGVFYYLPKAFNESFKRKYGYDVRSWPLAALSAVLVVAGLLMMDADIGNLLYVLYAVFGLIFAGVLFYCGYNAGAAGGSVLEVLLAVLLQIFATAGVVVFILLIVGTIMNSGKKRKR